MDHFSEVQDPLKKYINYSLFNTQGLFSRYSSVLMMTSFIEYRALNPKGPILLQSRNMKGLSPIHPGPPE
jgi:hypothetical protein